MASIKSKTSKGGLLPPSMRKLSSSMSPPSSSTRNSSANGNGNVQDNEMLSIISEITSKQKAYNLKKNKISNDRMIEDAITALTNQNKAEISRIGQSHQIEINDIQESLRKGYEDINVYGSRIDELLRGAEFRAIQRHSSLEAVGDTLNGLTSEWDEYLRCRDHAGFDTESDTVKSELHRKIQQLEALLHAQYQDD